MRGSSLSRTRAVCLLMPLGSLLICFPTRAQDSPPAAASEQPAATEPASQGGATVERLPPTAYPEWTVRGLAGGSLWLSGNMHGMPWPYYPRTGIGVSGYAWLDTGYETVKRGNPSEPNLKYLLSQGRAALRITPTYSAPTFYVQGQAELIANKDQSVKQPDVADVDDLWIRVGQWKKWDIQAGRFEAFEVYHFGMGMDLNTLERLGAVDQRPPPDVYGLTTVTYRQSGAGNLAFHLYPIEQVRIEALGQFGFDSVSALDTVGGRGAIVLDLGTIKLKAEGDARKQFPISSASKESRFQRGGSAAAQVVLAPFFEAGVNVAYGLVDHFLPLSATDPNAPMGDPDTAGSLTDLSFGGFANARLMEALLVGAGGNYTKEDDLRDGHFSHLQAFGALQYFFEKQLLIKVVGAYAKGHFAPPGVAAWDNTMYSGRLRLMYLF